MTVEVCQHIKDIKIIKTAGEYKCEECIKTGSRWLHLRTWQTCGITLCCDDSSNKHMTAHYYKTAHPVSNFYSVNFNCINTTFIMLKSLLEM